MRLVWWKREGVGVTSQGIGAPLLLEGPGLVPLITVESPPEPGCSTYSHISFWLNASTIVGAGAGTKLTWCPRKAGWGRKTGTGSLRCYSFAWGPPDSWLEGQERSHRKHLKWNWPLKRWGRNKRRRKENSRWGRKLKTWITRFRKNIQGPGLYPEDNATLSLKGLDRKVVKLIFTRQNGHEWILYSEWVLSVSFFSSKAGTTITEAVKKSSTSKYNFLLFSKVRWHIDHNCIEWSTRSPFFHGTLTEPETAL